MLAASTYTDSVRMKAADLIGLSDFTEADLVEAGEKCPLSAWWGTGYLEVKVENQSDVDKVMALIKQAYELQA